MQPIFRSQLVWVTFPIGTTFGKALPFQDQPVINGNYVVGAEVAPDAVMVLTPDQSPTTATPELYSVTWNDGSDKRHQDVPVNTLFAAFNGGIYKEYVPFLCDFQKSRVIYRGATALEAPEALAFVMYFVRPEDMTEYNRLMRLLETGNE